MYTAELEIAGRRVAFATSCRSAFDHLAHLRHMVGIEPFHFRPVGTTMVRPRVEYSDSPGLASSFDSDDEVFQVAFPWKDGAPAIFDPGVPFHNLLLYSIRSALEVERQRHGEYTLHASAVVRDGRAIVVMGDAEAGKTTTALHLCNAHGFAMFANDQVVVTQRTGTPWLVHGDGMISLRYSSLNRYSPTIALDHFTSSEASREPWNVKTEVSPTTLGLQQSEANAPISVLVKMTLDDHQATTVARVLSRRDIAGLTRVQQREEFFAKIDLYSEVTRIIRGASFTPLDETSLRFIPFSPPNLDRPEFLRRRVDFMNAVFDHERSSALLIRGPLESSCDAIVNVFDRMETGC